MLLSYFYKKRERDICLKKLQKLTKIIYITIENNIKQCYN